LIRDRLRADGRLGPDRLTVDTDDGSVGYAVGDQVLVTRNDHARGLLNGTTAVVTAADSRGLRLATRDGRNVHVDRTWLSAAQLDHGYAMTLHKAQGRTVHTALLLADTGLTAEAGYVGLSRGTHANQLYLDASPRPRDEQTCQPAPAWTRPAVDPRRARDDLLRQRRRHQLAMHQIRRNEGRSR
jgi:ATP-dependent exoDNAse (exonuclease V) alpha subunit